MPGRSISRSLGSLVRTTAAACVVAVGLGGCATVDRTPEYRAVAGGDFDRAIALYEAHIAEGGAEVALDQNLAGTAALAAGHPARAHRWFQESFNDLEDLGATTTETVGAIVGPERTKRWKGDPHERSMNAYYLGLTYWLAGDVDNAAASFKSGLLRDGDSQEGEARSDFAALWYLLGIAQRDGRHTDGGDAALARARQLLPENPWTTPGAIEAGSVLVVVDRGWGPARVAEGPHGSVVRYRARGGNQSGLPVSVDGQSVGTTSRALDVYRQAVTRGDKVLDHVNQGKAVFKEAATIAGIARLHTADRDSEVLLGAGLLALGLLTPSEADLRFWNTLPAEVHVALVPATPGSHRVTIDGAGSIDVEVRSGRVTLVYARDIPGALPSTSRPALAPVSTAPRITP